MQKNVENKVGVLQSPYEQNLFKANVLFGTILLVSTLYFIYWGLDYTGTNHTLIFLLATIFGIFMAFNIGGNDVANSFGTSVGAGTLSVPQALAVAAVFEVSGAVIAGGEVTDTIRNGIVDLGAMGVNPMEFVYIMMSSLVAAAFWLLFATKKGMPVSTTHSIVGGIVGASIFLGFKSFGIGESLSLIKWSQMLSIVVSWIISPLLGGMVSYALFSQIKKHVLNYNDEMDQNLTEIKKLKKRIKKESKKSFERLTELQQIAYNSALARDSNAYKDNDYQLEDLESDYYRELYRIEMLKGEVKSFKALQTWVPLFASFGSMVIAAMLLFKGLNKADLGLTTLHNYLIICMVGAGVWAATFIYAKTLKAGDDIGKATFVMFSWLQVFTACGFAFSHGSNDIANSIGPFAAIMDILRTGETSSSAEVPIVVMVTFGIALIVGLWFIGKEVIKTIGSGLTNMHPSSGFAAELSAAGLVLLASTFGLPVSSTHILVGAVLGIGLVNRNANWGLMKPIVAAWIITVPAAAILGAFSFFILNGIFS